jgi:hypothetical protein
VPSDFNPAAYPGDMAWVPALIRDVRNLQQDMRDMQQSPATYGQQGTVSAYIGGNTCDVTWDDGDVSIVEKPALYTPAVGDKVVVLFSPFLDPPKILIRVS